MSMVQQTNNNPIYNPSVGTPLYTYSNAPAVPQQQTVAVSTPNTSQIYNYPQTSIYPGQPQKQAASGVNIYIYNPSAIGGPTSNSTANATYTMPGAQEQNPQPVAQTPINQNIPNKNEQEQPNQNITIANTPISADKTNDKDEKKTKNIVELTDDYIKTLESYLKSGNNKVRQSGIKELIKRFEEDDSRYEDPALTALLNISLQDPDASNRLMAMSVVSSGGAHGDDMTKEILQQLQKSEALYGQEAMLANKALLKTAETRATVAK